jgi:hypothetical protein
MMNEIKRCCEFDIKTTNVGIMTIFENRKPLSVFRDRTPITVNKITDSGYRTTVMVRGIAGTFQTR